MQIPFLNRGISGMVLCACLGLTVLLAAAPAMAFQYPGAPGQGDSFSLGGNQPALGEGDRVPKMEAGFTKVGPDHSAQLFIVATMPSGAHTYSITQPKGGPIRSKIKVEPTADVPTIGEFQTATKPDVKHDEEIFPGVALEEQAGKIKWFAPIQLAPGAKPEVVRIEGKVLMQLCDAQGCAMPKDYAFTATYRPDATPEKEPAAVTPKETPAKPAAPPATTGSSATSLPGARTTGFSRNSDGTPPSGVTTNGAQAAATQIEAKPSVSDYANPQSSVADGEINWLPFTNAADLRNIIGSDLNYEKVHKNVLEELRGRSIWVVLLAGFVGGIILNFMPCVLPVIGLKILSFVRQSGDNRGRALALNVCYSAGLVAVFMILALLAVLLHLGTGELFGMTWFKITFAAVVFVMALSFMGIWEVPLPTFLGGGKSGELAAQEGVVGAFFKGVLTTFLATPCSAPLFGPAVAWATSQPPLVTFTVFLCAGLGMASPYLLIGAFPGLQRFLPKPGAWMETFKQVMGFVLMATVVYLLAVLKPHCVVPTVGFLFSLSFLCWWVGRIGAERELGVKLRAWALGVSIVLVTWIVMFPGLSESVLGPYHFRGLAAATAPPDVPATPAPTGGGGPRIATHKIVLVDFTASWCPNCHLYENTVLRTAPVIEALRQFDVVTLKADWSDDSPQVSEMLDILCSRQIPVIAIFSPHRPNNPTVYYGQYSQQDILDALKKAAEPS